MGDDGKTTRFTRIAAMEPGFLTNWFAFVVQRRLAHVFEVLCPTRLQDAVAKGLLP